MKLFSIHFHFNSVGKMSKRLRDDARIVPLKTKLLVRISVLNFPVLNTQLSCVSQFSRIHTGER